MTTLRQVAHQLNIVRKLAQRNLARRLGGQIEPTPDRAEFLAGCRRWLADAPDGLLVNSAAFDVPANRPPWFDTGLDLQAGEQVTWLACGRVYLSRALDIWVAPGFQLWARVGERGRVFSGTRSTHSFRVQNSGRLYLASYFPGEWADDEGTLATDPRDYRKASGGIALQLLRWQHDVDPATGLEALSRRSAAPAEAKAELQRLNESTTLPSNWSYLWFLGDAEIYRAQPAGLPAEADSPDEQAIHCCTNQDVGILQKAVELPLTPDTTLQWDWRVDRLPSEIAEDSLPTHDYLSIAVEFDNGQDITWYWSAELPPETIYTCPLPTWKHRETHIVIRSGAEGLGSWISESRNIYDDCIAALGEPAERIVKVWLIANSLFQRQTGECEYRNIRIQCEGQTFRV